METLLAEHWHQTPAEEAGEMLGTDLERGLDPAEVERRRERFGPNALTARKERGPVFRFLLQFHQPLVYILLAAALITALLGEWVDSGVILGVVLVNAIVGFIQEAKALDAIGALARTLRSEATVVRGDVKRRIPSVELVPGDVVLLQSGD
ncbi:MAG: cation-transporting P-type ATPase, partial [Candidatus Methylomirabilis sp.]|nr:cation-transporting P-type ATPase [Deltaproteobacteria bacterium]